MTSEARIGIRSDSKQAEQSVKSVQGLFRGLATEAKSSILTGVGLGAGVSAFNLLSNAVKGAVDFMGEAVSAAIEDEASVSRLTASLKANVPAWDGSTKAIDRRIEAGQKLGFSDDAQRASLALLVGATHDVTKAQEIQATAMDLARLKGISLEAASEALIKVEGGRFRSLIALGIKLRDGATATEALTAVQKVAAGQAETFGDSTAGAMAAVGIAFDELKEDIGRELMPVMTQLARFARDDLVPALRTLTQAAKDAEPVWDALAFVVDKAGKGLQVIGAPLIIAAALIGELGKEAEVASRVIEAETGRWAGNVRSFVTEAAAALEAGEDMIGSAAYVMSVPISDELKKANAEAVRIAKGIPGDIADALIQGQSDVESGMNTLTDLMNDEWTDASRIAYYKGILTSAELARGLAHGDADVRDQAMRVKDNALYQLNLLESGAADAAVNAGTTMAEQLRLQAIPVGRAAADLARGAKNNLEFTADGSPIINAWVGSMETTLAQRLAHFTLLTKRYGNVLGNSLPTEGPLQHPEQGGRSITTAWVKGLKDGLGDLPLPGLGVALPGMSGGGGMGRMAFAGAGGSGGSGGAPQIIQLVVDGRVLGEILTRQQYYAQPGAGAVRMK